MSKRHTKYLTRTLIRIEAKMSGWSNAQLGGIDESIKKLDRSTTKLSYIMIGLTVVLVLLTAELVWLTIKLLPK